MIKLILISCSDKKKEGGAPYPLGADPVPWLKNPELRQRLFEVRNTVFDLIKADKLSDTEKRQGTRGKDPRNSALVKGPDFDGNKAGVYLPACLRYDGRFFRTIRGKAAEEGLLKLWGSVRPPYYTLILSGLYGLVDPFDPIQEYTCHFADRILETHTSLKQIWRPVLTDIILDRLGEDGSGRVVDLLSEETYQDAFEWGRIYQKATCYHRAYKLKAGPETLINSALFFLNEVLIDDRKDLSLYHDRLIAKEYFDDPQEKILFEPELKKTRKEVAREGIQEVVPKLKKRFGDTWNSLSGEVKNQIANSEYSYDRNRDLRDYDFTSASICLSKAVEIWLQDTVVSPLITIPDVRKFLKNKSGKLIAARRATLGNISCFLETVGKRLYYDSWLRNDIKNIMPEVGPSDFEELEKEIAVIASKYRNGWAHREPMPKTTYEEFRIEAHRFFTKWVPKWKNK
jgi:cytoplasmic iron level regulating protein YaaA (DUF328/UPF0246 family)